MIRIYEADSTIEAHLLRGLLEQRGIPVHIVGEHLLGAMGDLPAHGLIGVLVPGDFVQEARTVVREFETAGTSDEETTPEPSCTFDPAEPSEPATPRSLTADEIGLLLAGAGLGFLTLVQLARSLVH